MPHSSVSTAPSSLKKPDGDHVCSVPFDAPFSITKYWSEPSTNAEKGTEEKWYIEGRAVIDKMDYQNDVVSPIAMQTALPDLDINSTVLYNHHNDEEVGKIAAYKFLGDAIYIKVLISKTRADVWQKIQEGVLRKFSMRGKVLAFDIRYVPQINTLIRYIKAMTINEISIVSVSAQAEVDFKWYVEKQDQPMAYHIEKAFKSSQEGGDTFMKKAREKKASPIQIVKAEDGTQTITLQVPEGFEKADDAAAADAVNLGDIEKAIQAANTNIDAIIQAAGQVPEDATDAIKALFGKIGEAAEALKKSGVSAEEDPAAQKASEEEKPSGNTLQIVLPGNAAVTQKADEAAAEEKPPKTDLTADILADANFQKALLGYVEKGLSMDEAISKASEDLQKASEAAAGDQTGIVKSLVDALAKKDQHSETVNTAVTQLAEIVSGQSALIDTLQKSVNAIPIRKGLQLTDEQVETERDGIAKSLEGKEPRDQLMTILSYALKDQMQPTT